MTIGVLDALDASVPSFRHLQHRVSVPLGMCNNLLRDTQAHRVLKALILRYPLLLSLSSKTNSSGNTSDLVFFHLTFISFYFPHTKSTFLTHFLILTGCTAQGCKALRMPKHNSLKYCISSEKFNDSNEGVTNHFVKQKFSSSLFSRKLENTKLSASKSLNVVFKDRTV